MSAAVLFDLDDTLVDQRTAARRAVADWAGRLGFTGPDLVRRWAEVSTRHYARYQRREITFAEQRRERVRDLLGRPLTDPEADNMFAGYLELYEAGWATFDDAIPTLRRARAAGLTVAVLTNGEQSQQRRKLERLSLAAEIDLMVSSSELPAGKPDPRAFQHTVALLGVDAEQTLMVGDSLPIDVLGARAAGLRAVHLDRDDLHADAGDGARVRSLHDLVLPF